MERPLSLQPIPGHSIQLSPRHQTTPHVQPTLSPVRLVAFSSHDAPTKPAPRLAGTYVQRVSHPPGGREPLRPGPGGVRAEVLSPFGSGIRGAAAGRRTDRKSTRLNSSHQKISYAVFCLKK